MQERHVHLHDGVERTPLYPGRLPLRLLRARGVHNAGMGCGGVVVWGLWEYGYEGMEVWGHGLGLGNGM